LSYDQLAIIILQQTAFITSDKPRNFMSVPQARAAQGEQWFVELRDRTCRVFQLAVEAEWTGHGMHGERDTTPCELLHFE